MSTLAPSVALGYQPRASFVSRLLKILYAPLAAPDLIFLAALAAMLFRPPDLKSIPIDRIAFAALLVAVALRLVLARERLRIYPATWPMLALLLFGLRGVMTQAYQQQAWSLLAAKWIVPVTLFHLAGIVFRDEASLCRLESFFVVALLYLTVMAVFYLFDFRLLIFPRFILDESIGIHADRARGPFLQAVANGVSLNLLGLLALHSFDRRRIRGLLGFFLLIGVPLALLATRTRAVWFAAAVSILLAMIYGTRRVRRAGLMLCGIAALGTSAFLLYRTDSKGLAERVTDRSPVDFRLDMYRAGWQMFMEKPLKGWGSEGRIQPEIERRISTFHPDYYLFHNTYLELAVERGLLGLGLYAWLMLCFLRLRHLPDEMYSVDGAAFLGRSFLRVWPLLLLVYLLNASAVVMNYQFVNGLLFTLAGILAAQNARASFYRKQLQR